MLPQYVTSSPFKRLLLLRSSIAGIGFVAALASLPSLACGRSAKSVHSRIVVFNAGALALPIRQALDSFGRRKSLGVAQESAGSVETVRKVIDLGKSPDVLALADTALFGTMLSGRIAGPVVALGRSRMVLAFTDRSRFADQITATNWIDVITRPGVETGRSDPTLDPAGYRALMVMQLAERYYNRIGIAKRLQAAASVANIRPKSADLIALLQTGNLDYAWEYESVAQNLGLRYITLPPEIDLGDAKLGAVYATAAVPIGSIEAATAGRRHKTEIVMRGAPIVFGAAVLKSAPNRSAGEAFLTYLTSVEGRSIFAANGFH